METGTLEERIADPLVREHLKAVAAEAGSVHVPGGGEVIREGSADLGVRGGRIVVDESGAAKGTAFHGVPKSAWWYDRPGNMSEAEIKRLVERVTSDNPGKITPRQAEMLEFLMYAEPSGGSPMRPPQGGAPRGEAPIRDIIGVRHADLDSLLESIGFETAKRGEKKTMEGVKARAEAIEQADPMRAAALLDELRSNPRARTPEETALIARLHVRAENLREQLGKELKSAANLGEDVTPILKRIEDTKKLFKDSGDVLGETASKAGQSLKFQQYIQKRDFSLTNIEREYEAANKGRPLSEATQKEIVDLYDKLNEAEREFATAQEEAAAREQATASKRAMEGMRREARQEKRQAKILDAKKRIEESLAEIRTLTSGRAGSELAGLDPKLLAAVVKAAKAHIDLGVHEFAKFADDFVGMAGEHIRPYLQEAWKQAEEHPLQQRYLKAKERELAKLVGIRDVGGEIPKRVQRQLSPPELVAKAKVEAVKREIAAGVERTRIESLKGIGRAVHNAKVVRDSFRAVKTGFDLSATLRQGAVLAGAHPIEGLAKPFGAQLRAFASKQKAHEIDTALKNRPMAEIARRAGVEHSEPDGPVLFGEESVRTRFVDKVPILAGSNRAFTTFLNVQRAKVFDALWRPDMTPAEEKAIANWVNVASGRGQPGSLAKFMPLAQSVLWSPRLYLSRMQLLTGQPIRKAPTARTKALMVREMAKSAGAIAAVYTLWNMMGGEVGGLEDEELTWDDMLSSDFGKLKAGNTRMDPLAGMQQFVVFGARENPFAGGRKSLGSGRVREMDTGKPLDPSSGGVLLDFLRTKLRPELGALVDLKTGHDFKGDPVTPAEVAENLVKPMIVGDVVDAIVEHGWSRGTAISVMAALGWGANTFDPNKPRSKPKPLAPAGANK